VQGPEFKPGTAKQEKKEERNPKQTSNSEGDWISNQKSPSKEKPRN
jgi:hypothetical protein